LISKGEPQAQRFVRCSNLRPYQYGSVPYSKDRGCWRLRLLERIVKAYGVKMTAIHKISYFHRTFRTGLNGWNLLIVENKPSTITTPCFTVLELATDHIYQGPCLTLAIGAAGDRFLEVLRPSSGPRTCPMLRHATSFGHFNGALTSSHVCFRISIVRTACLSTITAFDYTSCNNNHLRTTHM
jgi:hypothetical protein